jgi:hypothetical protein
MLLLRGVLSPGAFWQGSYAKWGIPLPSDLMIINVHKRMLLGKGGVGWMGGGIPQ